MKKINLLSTLSISQQKEIAQWHTYTVLGLIVIFICLFSFYLIQMIQIHSLKIENMTLQKKLSPYSQALDQYKIVKEKNEIVLQRLTQLKNLAQPTQTMINSICGMLQTSINPKSLIFTDGLFELSVYCIDNDKTKKMIQELNSIPSISHVRLSSLHHTDHGMLVIVKGMVHSSNNFS